MKTGLQEVKDMLQNAIDFAFPINELPTQHGVFTEQLRRSYEQAIGWLDSLTPLYKTMKNGGLSSSEAWNRCLIYSKALFDDIKTVRSLSAEKSASAMTWGSFRTTEVLREYERLRFVQHPQVSSILALTSMQREGKALQEALSALTSEARTIKTHTMQIARINTDLKNIRDNNPNLN